jgi:hypothetical protein
MAGWRNNRAEISNPPILSALIIYTTITQAYRKTKDHGCTKQSANESTKKWSEDYSNSNKSAQPKHRCIGTRVAIDWRSANREEGFGDLTISRLAQLQWLCTGSPGTARGGRRERDKGLPSPTRNRVGHRMDGCDRVVFLDGRPGSAPYYCGP